MKGFIQIPVLIAIVISGLVFGGGGYFVAKEITNRPQTEIPVDQTTVETIASSTGVVATTTTQISASTEKPKVNTTVKVEASKTTQTTVAPTQTTQTKLENKAPVTFQISNVDNATDKHVAVIVWNTTLSARSRLALKLGPDDEKIYESVKGIGTEHRVEIAGLDSSTEYDYHITAKAIDESALEDDLYGSFQTAREFVISLVGSNDGCQVISVIDTAGNPLAGKSVTVKGTYIVENITSYKPEVTLKTDSWGLVEYCYNSNKFEISTQELFITLP